MTTAAQVASMVATIAVSSNARRRGATRGKGSVWVSRVPHGTSSSTMTKTCQRHEMRKRLVITSRFRIGPSCALVLGICYSAVALRPCASHLLTRPGSLRRKHLHCQDLLIGLSSTLNVEREHEQSTLIMIPRKTLLGINNWMCRAGPLRGHFAGTLYLAQLQLLSFSNGLKLSHLSESVRLLARKKAVRSHSNRNESLSARKKAVRLLRSNGNA